MTTTDTRAIEVLERRVKSANTREAVARQDLAEAAAEEGVSWETLTFRANEVAWAAGYAAETLHLWLVAKGSGADRTALRDQIIQSLTQSPDDTWSGRSNDSRRRYNDGRRDAAKSVHDALQYGW